MSSSDVARSQRVLDKVGARLGLTEAGKQWLIAAVDPWHDTPLDVTGYPDVNEASSVVQVVKLSANIVSTQTAGQDWDCHIHQFPWMSPTALGPGNWSNTLNGDQSTGFGSFFLGTSITTPTAGPNSNCFYGALTVDQSLSSTGQTFTWTNGTSFVPFDAGLRPYLVGEYRVIAMGFEVINTTSELNVQGLCTVYRQPMASIDSAKTIFMTSGNVTVAGQNTFNSAYPTYVRDAAPPINIAEAMLLDGTKQWKAKEGCYVVSTMNSPENPAGPDNATPILHLSTSDTTAPAAWGVTIPSSGGLNAAFSSTTVEASSSTTVIGFLPTGGSWLQPFNHAGAYFTGLSPTTTLTVNAIYYIERFPSQQDSALVVLARESPRMDCVALDLYSEIIREMPVGVPQRMNGLGEWFSDAVSSAVDYISPVLSAIPLPMAQAAAGGLKTIGGIAKAIGSKKEAPGATYSSSGANVSAAKPKAKVQVMAVVPQKKKKKIPMKKK